MRKKQIDRPGENNQSTFPSDIHDIRALTATGAITLPTAASSARIQTTTSPKKPAGPS